MVRFRQSENFISRNATRHRMIDVDVHVRITRHDFSILEMTRLKGKDEAFKLIAPSISADGGSPIWFVDYTPVTGVWFTALFRVIRQWSITIETRVHISLGRGSLSLSIVRSPSSYFTFIFSFLFPFFFFFGRHYVISYCKIRREIRITF